MPCSILGYFPSLVCGVLSGPVLDIDPACNTIIKCRVSSTLQVVQSVISSFGRRPKHTSTISREMQLGQRTSRFWRTSIRAISCLPLLAVSCEPYFCLDFCYCSESVRVGLHASSLVLSEC